MNWSQVKTKMSSRVGQMYLKLLVDVDDNGILVLSTANLILSESENNACRESLSSNHKNGSNNHVSKTCNK